MPDTVGREGGGSNIPESRAFFRAGPLVRIVQFVVSSSGKALNFGGETMTIYLIQGGDNGRADEIEGKLKSAIPDLKRDSQS